MVYTDNAALDALLLTGATEAIGTGATGDLYSLGWYVSSFQGTGVPGWDEAGRGSMGDNGLPDGYGAQEFVSWLNTSGAIEVPYFELVADTTVQGRRVIMAALRSGMEVDSDTITGHQTLNAAAAWHRIPSAEPVPPPAVPNHDSLAPTDPVWQPIGLGPGQQPGPITEFEWTPDGDPDRGTDVRRRPGTSQRVLVRLPERPC